MHVVRNLLNNIGIHLTSYLWPKEATQALNELQLFWGSIMYVAVNRYQYTCCFLFSFFYSLCQFTRHMEIKKPSF